MPNVAVVGCGAIGLTTALEIQKLLNGKGLVTIFSEEFTPNTTSDVAAGLWQPYLLEETPPEDVLRWSSRTYQYILKLWQEGKAHEAGICLIPITNLLETEPFIVPEWTKIVLGYSVLSKNHLDSYSNRYKKKFTGGFCYTTFTWEAIEFLPFLTNQFVTKGGKIVEKRIENLEELSNFDVVVNCAGLNARNIVNDFKLKPFRGQIARVESPWLFHATMVEGSKACYVIPNMNSTILGGTKQENFSTEVDDIDSKDILDKCREIVPPLNDAKVLYHKVGLRPGRSRVRLEEEIKVCDSCKHGFLKIVHNYGHGGSGITLSIGCAEEAAKLVEKLLKTETKKGKL